MNLSDDATPSDQGLSEAEAQQRLLRDGPNRLPAPQHKSPAAVWRGVLTQPMVLLLVACTVLYALLGEAFDAVALSASIVVVAGIAAYQELRTQRVLEALRDLSSPRSTVVRGGVVRRIASQELVVGDRLIVQEGDRLACDAQLVQAHGMRVDESMLSGESVPVDKGPGLGDGGAQQLRAGTLVVQGDGVAQVIAIGSGTALGQIGGSLAALTPRSSRLHGELDRLVKGVALAALLTCLVASAVSTWRSGSWTEGLLVGLTLAMAIVPEEYAMVWTVMLALGAWRLAQQRVLTRQPQAIEALGSTTVLCVDKTGTLTRNRMEVVALTDGTDALERRAGEAVPEVWQPLLQAAAQASVPEGLEPMDQAIFRLRPGGPAKTGSTLLRRDGVQPGRPFVLQVWREGDGARACHWVLKGAPEALLARCDDAPPRLLELTQQAQAWASRGLRVIAVAQAWTAETEDVANTPEPRCHLVGLLGFADPLRDDVPAALQECRAAGVRVVMITGDAPATALAIARQAGLAGGGAGSDEASAVLTGAQLDGLSESSFEQRLAQVSVFARVSPAQKLRIVQALQRRGEVVAMTGDGVNDGPALRAADVGVAMGERGTDVAREAAALVLMDDRFPSLVDAVKAGRRIFANLHQALGYVLAVHVPIVGLSMLPLFGGPVLLLPLHVVLLELIIDPACTLVFEAEPLAPDGMRRPPRRADTPLFSLGSVVQALAAGGVALLVVVAVQGWGHQRSWSDAELRLAGLATIVAGNLMLLQWYRRGPRRAGAPNPVFPALVLAVCALSALVLGVPGVSEAFGLPVLGLGPVLSVLAWPAAWAGWALWRGRSRPGGLASEGVNEPGVAEQAAQEGRI